MDHSLKSIAFIADLGELLIVMARVRLLQPPESGGGGSGGGEPASCACVSGGRTTSASGGGAVGAIGGTGTNGAAADGCSSRRSSNLSSSARDDPHGLSQSLNLSASRPPAGSCRCSDHSLEPCPLHGQHVKVCL